MVTSAKKKVVKRPAVKKMSKPASKPKPKPKPKPQSKPIAPRPDWATKDDLRSLASKSALNRFATREELAGLVKKEELGQLPSKADWRQMDQRMDQLERNSQTNDKKIDLLATEIGSNPEALNNIHADLAKIRESISFLENKLSETPDAEHELLRMETRLDDLDTRIRNLEGVQ